MEGMDFTRAQQIIAGAIADRGRQLTAEREVELGEAVAFLIVSIPRSIASIAADVLAMRRIVERAMADDEPAPRQGMD